MINHTERIDSVIRETLSETCMTNGINTLEVGYSIGGNGATSLIQVGPNQLAPTPHWTLLISLRSKLLGQAPIAASVAIPGVLPSDDMFRAMVKEILPQVVEQREKEFRGEDLINGSELN